jgi:DNA-binding response OmpR family regulator
VNKPRILVVDDDDMVLKSTLRALRHDFDCVGVTRPTEALNLLLTESFAAVVSDVMMPELTGKDLHEAVSNEKPEMAKKFVFLTGGVPDRFNAWLAATPHLDKPCGMRELIAAVREVIGGKAG